MCVVCVEWGGSGEGSFRYGWKIGEDGKLLL